MSKVNRYEFKIKGGGNFILELTTPSRSFYRPDHLTVAAPYLLGLEWVSADLDPLYFLEWQQIHYTCLLETAGSFAPPFELRVNDRVLGQTKAVGATHLLTGDLSFNDQAGQTTIELRDRYQRHIFTLGTEVFPQKMDYQSDYRVMMSELTDLLQQLAYQSLKDTFSQSRARVKGRTLEDEWWNILDALFEQLLLSVAVIKRQPKHDIERHHRVLPIAQIRGSNVKQQQWFIKNNHLASAAGQGIQVAQGKYFTQGLSAQKHTTYDTYENRFIAWALRDIMIHLKRYGAHIAALAGTKDYAPLLSRIKKYQSKLQGLLHESPFNEVGAFEKRAHFSTSLTRGAGYKDFMHLYLILKQGLEFADNPLFKMSAKDISTLYEYWCFLKLVQVIGEQYDGAVAYQDLIRLAGNKFQVQLKKGHTSKVVYAHKESGEQLVIYFNREFVVDGRRLFTFNQRPDFTVEFYKNGYPQPFYFVLDAKYRFEEKADALQQVYNVPQDAIGQLHRYRDALRFTQSTTSAIKGSSRPLGGVILYPYPLAEQTFRQNRYFKSLAATQLGALPFLPSKTALVKEFMQQFLQGTLPEQHFESFIGFDHTAYSASQVAWNQKIAMVTRQEDDGIAKGAALGQPEIYYWPWHSSIARELFQAPYLLICQKGKSQATLYQVISTDMQTQAELPVPHGQLASAGKYVVMELKTMKEVQVPAHLTERAFRYTTLAGLEQFQQEPTNNALLLLPNFSAKRLYDELKRAQIDFELHPGDEEKGGLVIFEGKGYQLVSSLDFADLHYQYRGEIIPLAQVLAALPR